MQHQAAFYLVPPLVRVSDGAPNAGPIVAHDVYSAVQWRYLRGYGPAGNPTAWLKADESCRRFSTLIDARAEGARRGYWE